MAVNLPLWKEPAEVVTAGRLQVCVFHVASYTQIFMASVGQFITQFFPLVLLGAIFGELMGDAKAAVRIAEVMVRAVGRERTLLAIVLSCAVLTYGRVSLFVVFAVFPLLCPRLLVAPPLLCPRLLPVARLLRLIARRPENASG